MTDCVDARLTPALEPMDVAKDVNAGWWLLLKNASKMTQSTGQAEKIRILGSFLGLSWARIGCELLLERQIFLLPREHSREEDGLECPRFSESQDGLRMLCVSQICTISSCQPLCAFGCFGSHILSHIGLTFSCLDSDRRVAPPPRGRWRGTFPPLQGCVS